MRGNQTRPIYFNPAASPLICLVFVLLLAACTAAPSPPPTEEVVPTLAPPTDTPLPTNTPAPTPTDTPVPTETPDRTATISARETGTLEAELNQYLTRLEKFGFDRESGRMIYQGEPTIYLTVDSYQEDKLETIIADPIKDFVLQAEIEWNSTSGLAGCGIIFRAEEDLERGANYQWVMMRLSGAPAWDIEYFRYGEFQYGLMPAQFTAALDERQGAVNRITLIAQGDTFKTYINTTPGMDASDKKLSEGQIALLAWQESGKTTCTFRNVWVWELIGD